MITSIFHLLACIMAACSASCNQGQGRCYIGPDDDVCCNFYLNNVCVAECPAPLVPDDNFNCGKDIAQMYMYIYILTMQLHATPMHLYARVCMHTSMYSYHNMYI